MNANQADLPVRAMCRVLDVSASGYYDWLSRAPSQRSIDDAVLLERIRTVHVQSDGTYGAPRIHAELAEQGRRVGRKRVARLMRQGAIAGVSRRRGLVVTTQRDQRQRPAPDLVQREFTADGPNRLWVADITYVPTWAGFIYLAVVLDVWSRRVVGCWSSPMWSALPQTSAILPQSKRKMLIPVHVTTLPVAGTASQAPCWVPVADQRETVRSPCPNDDSTVNVMSGNAARNAFHRAVKGSIPCVSPPMPQWWISFGASKSPTLASPPAVQSACQ